MVKPWLLDTGPLGRLSHPAGNPAVVRWFERQTLLGIPIIIPEISDYELRRNLLLEGLTRSIVRLNQLEQTLTYLPITTAMMREAAELWAETRRRGRPTADEKALDGDAILAAQARAIGARIATENVGHLNRWVEAFDWRTEAATD